MDNGCFAVMIKSRFTSVSQKIIYWQWSFHRNHLWLVSLPIIWFSHGSYEKILGHVGPYNSTNLPVVSLLCNDHFPNISEGSLTPPEHRGAAAAVESWYSCGFFHNKIGWFINVYHLPPQKKAMALLVPHVWRNWRFLESLRKCVSAGLIVGIPV